MNGIGKAKCHKLVSLSEHLAWLRTKLLDAIPELKDTASAGVTAANDVERPPRCCSCAAMAAATSAVAAAFDPARPPAAAFAAAVDAAALPLPPCTFLRRHFQYQ